MELDEEQAITQVVESLVITFPAVPEPRIRECVERVLSTFIDAKVRSFLPILVAREARAELAVPHAADEVGSGVRLAYRDGDAHRGSDRRFGEVALEDTR